MGGLPLTPPTQGELENLADETGFAPDQLEKTLRLLALIDAIADHPYLSGRLALTGGTALNMFILDASRLSFDLDLNYIGATARASMIADRPKIESDLAQVFAGHELSVKRRPHRTDHAGGKWNLRYISSWGGRSGLSVDVNFVRRVPLWPPTLRSSLRLGRWQATGVPVFDIHEIAAGKLAALFDRAYPRDLFDAGLIADIPGLDRARLRTAFVVYGGGARSDWRSVCRSDPSFDAHEVVHQLRAALPRSTLKRSTRPDDAETFVDDLTSRATGAMRLVVPLTAPELAFLDRLIDHGEIAPDLLTGDAALQQHIESEPWLRWKALNVRRHKA